MNIFIHRNPVESKRQHKPTKTNERKK